MTRWAQQVRSSVLCGPLLVCVAGFAGHPRGIWNTLREAPRTGKRGRALSRQQCHLHTAVYLVGTVYKVCAYHHTLRLQLTTTGRRRRWLRRTLAIAAGITNHSWTVQELLWYRRPHPPALRKWQGRFSKADLVLRKRWAYMITVPSGPCLDMGSGSQ